MKKILIITEAGDAYPSGKIRAFIYKDLFLKNGYDVKFKSCLIPFITKFYVNNNAIVLLLKRTGIFHFFHFLNSKIFRQINIFFILLFSKKYDIIYLQKIFSLKLVSKLRKTGRARLIYDLNDGLWLPTWHDTTGGDIEQILISVDAITCDNPFGIEYAKKLNSNSYLIPDSPQVELFDLYRNKFKRNSGITIGWVGTPGTLFNLYSIWEPLESIFKQFDHVHLRIVGGGNDISLLPPFENVRYSVKPFYSQTELIEEVLKMDIGLFPLFHVENSMARGILKAAVYMSGEVAVIGSAVGQSVELIRDGVNGMLASNNSEWEEKLEQLISNIELRKKIARSGLETVRSNFTIASNFEKLLSVFEGTNG